VKSQRWKQISRFVLTWDNNIKIHYTEILCCFLKETKLAVDVIEWWNVMNMVTRDFVQTYFPPGRVVL